MPPAATAATDPRSRIVGAAARLLAEGGEGAVTTRSVALAAGVQAPAIYRLFGDKDGLLDAVGEHVLADFVATKAGRAAAEAAEDNDPVEDLRASWRVQVAFGLANPALFRMLYTADRGDRSPAVAAGLEVLRSRVRRIAEVGRLRVPEDRAVAMIRAAGAGAMLTVLAEGADTADRSLPEVMLDAVLGTIVAGVPAWATADDGVGVGAVAAVRARADALPGLSPAERTVLAEWLDRTLAAGRTTDDDVVTAGGAAHAGSGQDDTAS